MSRRCRLDDATEGVGRDIDLESFLPERVMPPDRVGVQSLADDGNAVVAQQVRLKVREEPDMRLTRVKVEIEDHAGRGD